MVRVPPFASGAFGDLAFFLTRLPRALRPTGFLGGTRRVSTQNKPVYEPCCFSFSCFGFGCCGSFLSVQFQFTYMSELTETVWVHKRLINQTWVLESRSEGIQVFETTTLFKINQSGEVLLGGSETSLFYLQFQLFNFLCSRGRFACLPAADG